LSKLRIWQLEAILNKISPLIDLGTAHWLDVGCGDGTAVNYLNKLKIHAIGIDPYTQQASDRIYKESIEDFLSHQPVLQFNVISLLDVIEHFTEPHTILHNLSARAKAGTRIIIKVPNKDSMLYSLAKILIPILPSIARKLFGRLYQINYPPPHYSYFDQTSLSELALANKLTIESSFFISETPIQHLYTRLGTLPFIRRVGALTTLVLLEAICPTSKRESMVFIARV
jgi:SAM-dependent methyltransferase